MTRENILHHVGRLRALIDGEQILGRVVVCQDAARFIGDTSVPAKFIDFFNHHIGLGKGVIKALGHKLSVEAFVVTQIGMNDHIASKRGFHVSDGG